MTALSYLTETVGGPRSRPTLVAVSPTCSLRPQVPLSKLTSFRVGGRAEWYVAPRSLEDLQLTLQRARTEGWPVTVLGAGSNLLVSDRGLPGLAISTRYLRYTHIDGDTGRITAAAGEPLPRLAWQAAEAGASGFEWAVGIPGTVGGAVVMNAGAHRSSTADVLREARVINSDGSMEVLVPEDLDYQYRTSNLQGGDRLVVEATFDLVPGGDRHALKAATQDHLERRHRTQPYDRPSCGSVFRNPGPQAAGWLIERTGLKGYRIGGAMVAERHANFILNCGNATASDIFRLIAHVRESVHDRWSLWLEPEVRVLGEFGGV